MLAWRLFVAPFCVSVFGSAFGLFVCLPASILAHRTPTFPLNLPCSLEMSRDYPVKIKKG